MEIEDDEELVNDIVESRHSGVRMRFPADPDTTARLQKLRLDSHSQVPWWRRLLRWLRGESW